MTAVALLLGGGTAVAVGITAQDAAPPSVPVAQEPAPATTSATTSASEVVTPRPTAEPTEPEPAVAQPAPVRVRVPSIDVSSRLLTLGLATDGTVAVPPRGPDYDRAAWFDGSPRPGATGPAVIEGHVDGLDGPSVFYDLATVEPGAKVYVDRDDGTTVTFVVDKVRSYPKDAFPTLAVYGNTDDAELRLITCGGSFDRATGHYRDNTVVYAHLA